MSVPHLEQSPCNVVIPFGSVSQLPEVRDAVQAIRSQGHVNQRWVHVILSYVPEVRENLGPISDLCQEFEAVFYAEEPHPYSAFPKELACRLGAGRAAEGPMIYVDIELAREVGGESDRQVPVPDPGKRPPVERQVPAQPLQVGVFPSVSIVISASSDEYRDRLYACLDSVRRQIRVNHGAVEIIVSSVRRTGSGELQNSAIRDLSSAFGARFVEGVNPHSVFNLSLSRNVGARAARGSVLCFLDADMILPPMVLCEALERTVRGSFCVCRAIYAKNEWDSTIYRMSDLRSIESVLSTRKVDAPGEGGFLVLHKAAFNAVRGFDEEFLGWGWEDNDFCKRLRASGCKEVDLTKDTGLVCVHQWHRPRWDESPEENRYRLDNKKRYEALPDRVLANPRSMGGVSNGLSTLLIPSYGEIGPMLKDLDRATPSGMDHVVDVVGRSPVAGAGSVKYERMSVNVVPPQGDLARDVAESIDRFLSRGHAYWLPIKGGQSVPDVEGLVFVLEHEGWAGDVDVELSREGASPLVYDFGDRGALVMRRNPRAQVGHILRRDVGGTHWLVGDLTSSWGAVHGRALFERHGISPDPEDLDLGIAARAHRLGMKSATMVGVPGGWPLRPGLLCGGKPRVLLVSDVRGWAFDQNFHDLEEALGDRFDFDHGYVWDWVVDKSTPFPDFYAYDVVFAPYHRWGIEDRLPMDRTVGALRAQWVFPEHKRGPRQEEFDLVNSYSAFQVVTRKNYEELREHCPGVFPLTNPINMRRFPEPSPPLGSLVASWNGNAGHSNELGEDVKGFRSVIVPACRLAGVRLECAEYTKNRLAPHEMPVFYGRGNVSLCASLYEGASSSVMEGMAAGHALIATDVGNHREMHESMLERCGDSGIVIVERDIGAFAKALRDLRRSPKRVREMGLLNREEIALNWSWDAWKDRFADFLMMPLRGRRDK